MWGFHFFLRTGTSQDLTYLFFPERGEMLEKAWVPLLWTGESFLYWLCSEVDLPLAGNATGSNPAWLGCL